MNYAPHRGADWYASTKLSKMSEPAYYKHVFAVVRCVPPGRVTTYGAVASFLILGSARMVGWALNRSLGSAEVPAHRVVNRKGELSGRLHFADPSLMATLLQQEGVAVADDRVPDFERLFWDPATELGEDFELPR